MSSNTASINDTTRYQIQEFGFFEEGYCMYAVKFVSRLFMVFPSPNRLSNFIICKLGHKNDHIYNLINEHGASIVAKLDPIAFKSSYNFRTALSYLGDYSWIGNDYHLSLLNKKLHKQHID